MKILITGGNGLLAQTLCNIKQDSLTLIPRSKTALDITNLDQISQSIEEFKADVILHCAALTRPMIKHEENPELSIQTNIIGTANIALMCIRYKIKPIFISTDYVYDGKTGNYSENDPLKGINFYGWSKIAGECAIKMVPNYLILRCSFAERPFPHKYVPSTSFKSFLYVDEIAPIILKLIEKNIEGIINVGGERKSIYEFAKLSNLDIVTIDRKDIDKNYPYDTSMNISKMKEVING